MRFRRNGSGYQPFGSLLSSNPGALPQAGIGCAFSALAPSEFRYTLSGSGREDGEAKEGCGGALFAIGADEVRFTGESCGGERKRVVGAGRTAAWFSRTAPGRRGADHFPCLALRRTQGHEEATWLVLVPSRRVVSKSKCPRGGGRRLRPSRCLPADGGWPRGPCCAGRCQKR